MDRPEKFRSAARYLLLCLVFISAEISAQLKRAPAWVSQVPVTENAFFGLGIAEIQETSKYRTQARKMALREIIEKIQISINSQSELKLRYEDDEVEYLLDEKIAVESSSFLSGHQKVDEWIDKKSKKYYVLFRLNESTYRENRRAYFQQFDEIIHFIRSEAHELFAKGEIVRGIKKLSDGIVKLDDQIEGLIEPEYLVNLQKSRLSALYELEEQLTRMVFKTSTSYDFDPTTFQPLTISNFLVDRITGTPIRNLETRLKVLEGDVFNYEFLTKNGQSNLNIYGAYPANQTIEIQLIAETPLPNRVKTALDPTIFKQLNSSRIKLHFKPYEIAFNSDEMREFEVDESQPLTTFIRTITNDLALEESPELEAEYQIQINSHNRILKRQRESYTAQYEASISIVRLSNNREVYQFSIPEKRVKAGKESIALNNARKEALNESKKFLQSFVTFLCSKPTGVID